MSSPKLPEILPSLLYVFPKTPKASDSRQIFRFPEKNCFSPEIDLLRVHTRRGPKSNFLRICLFSFKPLLFEFPSCRINFRLHLRFNKSEFHCNKSCLQTPGKPDRKCANYCFCHSSCKLLCESDARKLSSSKGSYL